MALAAAAPRLLDASDQIAVAAGLVRSAFLPAAALGEVEGAAEFARAVQTFVDSHGEDLEHGSLWMNDAAEALVKVAENYEQIDQELAAQFTRMIGD